MKFLISLPSLAAFAAAVPCHAPKSTITLRLYTSPAEASTHYIPAQQVPTTPPGATLQLLVGQVLSLDHAPLRLQGIEIASISRGADLSNPPLDVWGNDAKVICKVKTRYGSGGMMFGIGNGIMVLGEEEDVDVTGLECWLQEDKEV